MSCVNNRLKAEQTFKNKHIKGVMKRGTSAIESVVVLLVLTFLPATATGDGQTTVTVNKPSTTKVPDERNWVSVSVTGKSFSLLIVYNMEQGFIELMTFVRFDFYICTLNEVPC